MLLRLHRLFCRCGLIRKYIRDHDSWVGPFRYHVRACEYPNCNHVLDISITTQDQNEIA